MPLIVQCATKKCNDVMNNVVFCMYTEVRNSDSYLLVFCQHGWLLEQKKWITDRIREELVLLAA